MAKYNPDRPCPKCGSTNHSLKHVNQWTTEWISVGCNKCGYTYTADPLDKKEESHG